ncbi:MAG: S-methyl-5-thioribose-1-phosphate isomerase [Bacteroidales bacterium]|jgi:methylthioribose-1-phosphate isomerase|nr:S-methyl-5-thioribose-1-phosphate isomerase [Bacteroidales bacterium]
MKVGTKDYRSIWHDEEDSRSVHVIDQRRLPFALDVLTLRSAGDVCDAIISMAVRGAPLIGAAAAWGIYLSFIEHRAGGDVCSSVLKDAVKLKATRPTAVNLAWAVDYMTGFLNNEADEAVMKRAVIALCDMEAARCRSIGEHGLPLIEDISRNKKEGVVNILTHCNAGWLACVDYGTALAPVYLAHDKGIKVHVWVDETRPRNQGSRLTAWELTNHGVPCTLITDNAGGHLMQKGMVDLAIVGCDRATASGDVANKIGTYLKALAAYDNGVPFYSAFPVSTFDMTLERPGQIVIEERDGNEVRIIAGIDGNVDNEQVKNANKSFAAAEEKYVYICHPDTEVVNFGFDVTPARLITGLITDRGICRAEKKSILKLLS